MLAAIYGQGSALASPSYQSMRTVPNGAFISFLDTGGGLVCKGERVEGFAISGADQRFYWAEADIEPNGKEIAIHSDKVAKPVAVRYAWADNPQCNLYSKDGLPVVPFRTDKWKNDGFEEQYATEKIVKRGDDDYRKNNSLTDLDVNPNVWRQFPRKMVGVRQ